MMDRIFFGVIAILIIGVVYAMGVQSSQQNELKGNCKKTNLYVIGYKGHINNVFECSEKPSFDKN